MVKIKTLLRSLKRKKVIIPILIVLVLGFIFFRPGQKENPIETQAVKSEEIKSVVTASGVVSAQNSAKLHFSTAGKVSWVNVEDGEAVSKGRAIAGLVREEFEIALRQAQQDVVQTDAVLQQTYDSLNMNDDVESYSDKVRRTAAEADKNQAFDALKQAEKNIRDSVIYSPIAGTIIELNVVPGEEVLPTTEIGIVADTAKKEFVADIDETDIGKVQLGQSAQITLDAYPDDPIEATVTKIDEQSTTASTGATAFQVSFSLPQGSIYRIGLNGEVEITIDQKQNALTIPLEALIDDNHVWVKDGENYVNKEVTLGIESDLNAEVLTGLSENEQVVIAGQDQIGKKSFPQSLFSK